MRRRALVGVALVAGAVAVGLWLARAYFLFPPDLIPHNHEWYSYVYRVVEFRDLLAAGYWSPHWATHFRAGLGSPYFGYYQPGFFYLASLVPWSVDPMRAMGCVVVASLVFGFMTTFALIRSRFGAVAGFAGATAFVAAPYLRVEVLVRGDLSEFTAMMMVPFAMHRFLDAFERGRARDLVGLAVGVAAVVCTHPAVGLFLGLALGGALGALTIAERRWTGGVHVAAALAVAVGLAGFYVLPVAFEVEHVLFETAFRMMRHYAQWFIEPLDLFAPRTRFPFPVTLGALLVAMAALNVAWFLGSRRTWSSEQRRFLGFALCVSVLMLLLMSSTSALVWERFPLLPKVQFPGRALAVLTPAVACVAGAIGGTRPRWRYVLLAALALASLAQSIVAMTPGRPVPFRHVTRAADLVTTEYFRPDIADEWMPRGANRWATEAPAGPSLSWGTCTVTDFRRAQGRLSMHVADNADGCFVILPHLFFPLGWQVTIDDAERGATLEQGTKGFMRVGVPPGVEGTVDVRFNMTPMRRLGWIVTAASATFGFAGLMWLARRRLGRDA